MEFTGERLIPDSKQLYNRPDDERLHFYAAATTLAKGKNVLDINCADGTGTVTVAGPAKHVTGVDSNADLIATAIKVHGASKARFTFLNTNNATIPFPNNSFDLVLSFNTIDGLDHEERVQFIAEIKRVLATNGLVLIASVAKPADASMQQAGSKSFTREDFIMLLSNNFAVTQLLERDYQQTGILHEAASLSNADAAMQPRESFKSDRGRFTFALAGNKELPRNAADIAAVPMKKESTYAATFVSTEHVQDAPSAQQHSLQEQLQMQIGKSEMIRKQLEDELKAQQATITKLNAQLQERDLLTAELNSKLHRLYQESDKTKERLTEIYDSDGWRLLSRYYRLKGKLLPEDSSRYKQLRKFVQFLKGKRESMPAATTLPVITALNVVIEKLTIPSFDYPTVSIIIPAYNGWRMNYQCISSIIKNTVGVAYEIILADDASTDETAQSTSVIENLVHIRSEANRGFLGNCNHAAGYAKGKYLLFLNNDTTVGSNWLTPMVQLAEEDELVGMVGAKLVYPDGRLQEAGGIIWNDASGWNYGHGQDPRLPEFNYVKEADYLSGACLLIRNTIWKEAGGFDKRYSPAYFEDADLAFTIRDLGYKVLYQPLSSVIHYEGYSHGTDKNSSALTPDAPSIKSFQALNRRKFFNKWQHVLLKEHFPHGKNVFHARDRSATKKTMLVVDHYVPHFDKDAGSKTTFQYLSLFASMDLNVKFLGDNFFQHEPYTTSLQQLGIEVLYGPWYHDNWQQWIEDNGKNIDYIYLNRPHISIKYIDYFIKTTQATILYYGHDLHFLREQKQYEVEQNPKLLKSAQKWKETECYLFEHSDIVLTPSDEENKIIAALSPRYRVETILPYFFSEPASALTEFDQRADILFVGGFNHQPNVDAVVWFSESIWPLLKSAIYPARFIVVGSNPPPAITALQTEDILVRGFVSEPELHSIYRKAKLVVIPLRYGAGVKGKTVEALYQGIPVVTTSFGVEGMPGNTEFIEPQNEATAFADEVIRLYTNNQLLATLSLQGTNYINSHFTQKAAAEKMDFLLGRSLKK